MSSPCGRAPSPRPAVESSGGVHRRGVEQVPVARKMARRGGPRPHLVQMLRIATRAASACAPDGLRVGGLRENWRNADLVLR